MVASIVFAIFYKIWRKRRSSNITAPSAAYGHRYAPISLKASQNTLFVTNQAGSTSKDVGIRNLPSIIVTPASSIGSLPSHLYVRYLPEILIFGSVFNPKEPPEPSAYSPAVESSDVFGSHGGYSPTSTERTVSLSHFVRLVPQRRPGGRW